MPTTYTHDLFGKNVYRKLPEEVRAVIRKNGELFRIGLHGPDILFYYMISKNPVSSFGVKMHQESAKPFFQEGMAQVRETSDSRLLAYLLGFGCHYLLDSACHPYVEEVAEGGVVSHTVLEKEFDRSLMLETGKDPFHFYPSRCVVPRWEHARVIHRAIRQVRTGNIWISLKMMRFLTDLMVCDDGGRRRKRLEKLFSMGGQARSKSLLEHFMTISPVPESTQPVRRLREYYNEAISAAPGELMELYRLSKEEKPLSERWNKTYNG